MDNQLIMTAVLMFLSSVATFLVQYMRRDKTESEADVNASQAEKIKADAMMTMYQTVASITEKLGEVLESKIDNVQSIDALKRDVWRLEGENQTRTQQDKQRIGQITTLEAKVMDLMKSKVSLEAKVERLTKTNDALEKQVKVLTKASTDKDAVIGTLRDRIQALETERADLNKQLEQKVSSGDNGEIEVKDGPVVEKTVAKPPEIDSQKTAAEQ